MSIDTPDVVDSIGIDGATGRVVLTISDHWDWGDPVQHLEALQAKIISYLAFIEGGEWVDTYPDAKGRDVVVDIVAKYESFGVATEFLEAAAAALASANATLSYRVLPAGPRS